MLLPPDNATVTTKTNYETPPFPKASTYAQQLFDKVRVALADLKESITGQVGILYKTDIHNINLSSSELKSAIAADLKELESIIGKIDVSIFTSNIPGCWKIRAKN